MAENGILDYHGMNQAIYRGATSNIVVDTQSMSIEIGAGNTSHTSNLHFECNHDANVASIKLNSNVVTEFPRSKKLIRYPRVALSTNAGNHSALGSGYTQDGYTVKVSSELTTTLTGTKAFTNTNLDNADTWISDQLKYSSGIPVSNTTNVNKFGQNGEWLEIKLPNKIKLSSTRIFSRRTYVTERNDTADIWASNTGTDGDWVKLTTINFNDTYTDVIPMIAEIDTQNYYSYFAIQITEIGWNGGTYVNIGEWELFGTPEYDPEAHGVDVVVKSVPNVPNTDWLEVYFDAKGLPNGAVTNPISGLGGTTNNGTAAGDLTVSDGVFTFDGTNDSISTTSTATLSYHTATMWIKFEQFSSWAAVYAIRPASLDRNNAFLYANGTSNTFRLEALGNTGPYKDFDYTFEPGKWFHLTVLFDGTGLRDSKLYINGIELAPNGAVRNVTDDITITGTTTVYMGSEPGYYFTGSFANFRLFNRVITTDEIYQLYAYQKEEFGHSTNNMTLKAGRLGIGTSEPKAALDVRGDIHGGMPVFFDARFTSAPTATHVGSRIVFDTLNNSRGGGFDTSTGIFTAPIAGQYKFSYFMRGNIANQGIKVKPRINGSPTFATTNDGTNQNLLGTAFCGNDGLTGAAVCIVPLEAGGTFELIACTHGGTVNSALASYYSGFTGEYISSL